MSTRKRPAPTGRPSSNNTNECHKSIALHGHDRVEPLDAEDRADIAVLEAAAQRGYRLATQCTVCGHWLTSRRSLLAHVGPKCSARQVAE